MSRWTAGVMAWFVLAWERRIHEISCFVDLNYHARWCRITLLYLLFTHYFIV